MSSEASENAEMSRIRRIAEWMESDTESDDLHGLHSRLIIRLQMEVGRHYIRRRLLADDNFNINTSINNFNNIGNNGPLAAAASKASIDAMPRVTVTSQGAECSICLEGLEVGAEAREMPCKHRFHSLCIELWLGRRGSCPLCRFSMP
ncbi:PREDICTED: E3 [Prunus dulcis]|uniref:RING-type E3 ubiquitin transferase n=1 Tax=Prunus dulcis TaxID=3755 RepID=A0A5E4EQ05_PRUDU|nr:hypothetical protein L3X38_020474 [Prunus dulcis]VVA17753.1 PREDICTED: E3 [Prunus dulcis]